MHSCTCNHRSTRLSDGLHIYPAPVSMTLFGVGWRGDFSSHKIYTRLLERLASANKWDYFNKVCSKTPWPFKNLVGSSPFLGVPLQLFCVLNFRRKLQSCRRTWCQLSYKMVGLLRPILLSFFDIISGSMMHSTALLWRRLWTLVPWFPCVTGAPKFSEGLLRNYEWCIRKYLTWLLVLSSRDGEFINGIS